MASMSICSRGGHFFFARRVQYVLGEVAELDNIININGSVFQKSHSHLRKVVKNGPPLKKKTKRHEKKMPAIWKGVPENRTGILGDFPTNLQVGPHSDVKLMSHLQREI